MGHGAASTAADPRGVMGASHPPLEELAGRARPVALARDRVLPVHPPLEPLLPDGGLRRGTVVDVPGSTSLALALLAGASATGSWCAAVGLSSLGLVAAAELGIALDRFPLVAAPPNLDEWAWAVAALLDAVDVVLARPPRPIDAPRARRLAGRARERSAVLVVTNGAATGRWPEGADLSLSVIRAAWEGVGQGHGYLRARRVDVVAEGRGAASRPRRVSLWLPGPGGGVAAASAQTMAPVGSQAVG
ncbi:MAG: hypothetical protein M3314_11745 [Actinomycetota bacterium]|nr:hypothetical protein [Actinomycetota bacterium]